MVSRGKIIMGVGIRLRARVTFLELGTLVQVVRNHLVFAFVTLFPFKMRKFAGESEFADNLR